MFVCMFDEEEEDAAFFLEPSHTRTYINPSHPDPNNHDQPRPIPSIRAWSPPARTRRRPRPSSAPWRSCWGSSARTAGGASRTSPASTRPTPRTAPAVRDVCLTAWLSLLHAGRILHGARKHFYNNLQPPTEKKQRAWARAAPGWCRRRGRCWGCWPASARTPGPWSRACNSSWRGSGPTVRCREVGARWD